MGIPYFQMMQTPGQYQEVENEGQQFLNNHNQLLDSLIASKQNASNNSVNQDTQGIGNEFVQPG